MTEPPVTPGSGHDRQVLDVTWDELHSSAVESRVELLRQAQHVPLTRTVGPPPPPPTAAAGSHWWRGQLPSMVTAGLVGGLASWLVIEVVMSPDQRRHWYGESVRVSNVLFSVVLGGVLGCVIVTWSAHALGGWAKVGPALLRAAGPLLGAGLLFGFITDSIYTDMTQSLVRRAIREANSRQEAMQIVQHGLHLPRGIAWALVGLSVGLALGLASRALQRVVNGALGGLIGGFLGGFLFDYFSSGPTARFVGLAIMGTLVGLSIGLVEQARRAHWLEILSGGMAGKQFILYANETVIGASVDADVTLVKDPGIAPRHVALRQTGTGMALQALDPAFPVHVDGRPVANGPLADGSTLQIGSSLLRYASKQKQKTVSNQIDG